MYVFASAKKCKAAETVMARMQLLRIKLNPCAKIKKVKDLK